MTSYTLNPDYHTNQYFVSENSFSEALGWATEYVAQVESEGGSLVSITAAEFYQDDVVDDNGFHAPLYQVFVTVVR